MPQQNVPEKAELLEMLRRRDGTQFVIPAYQRNYTWTAQKEVKQLLEDIQAVLRGERTKHFIGIMIYLENSIGLYRRENSVIDGQQRLTTIFLTLYAIKELMLEKGLEGKAKDLDKCLTNRDEEGAFKFKLKPLVSDNAVYQQIVNRDFDNITPQDKKSNVYLNFKYIKETLENILSSTEYSLNDILEAINKLYLVCVPIGQDDYPQKIFESINATGAKLTASDLIRNYMLMPISSDLQDEYYDKYWKKLESLIDSDSKKLEAFFRFFIAAKRQKLINKSAVYREFTDWYEENIHNFTEEGIFKEVVNYAQYHNALYKAPLETLDSALRKPIEEFRLILSDMPAPLLMELYAIHKQTNENGQPLISAAQLATIITILNAYLMRRSLCDMDTSDITRYFPILLKELLADCNGDYSNIVELFKKDLVNRNKGNSQEMPDDHRLRERILNANMYNLRTWVAIFFRKLESEDNPAPVDFRSLSIEHLMPQTPTIEWYEALETDKETYDTNLHRLGNLTLAARPDNSKMQNKVWEYKNKILSSTGHLKMNMAILEKQEWTLKDIDERTQSLIEEIARLYPYYEAKESIKKIPIRIDQNGAIAHGYYYVDNRSVEILAGSTISDEFPNPEKYPYAETMHNKLIEDDILAEVEGKYTFTSNYFVYPKRADATALSPSAELILHGTRNGWWYWETEDGKPIRDSEELEGTNKAD